MQSLGYIGRHGGVMDSGIVLTPFYFGTDMNKKNTLSKCNKDIYLHLNMNTTVNINTMSFPVYREYVKETYQSGECNRAR